MCLLTNIVNCPQQILFLKKQDEFTQILQIYLLLYNKMKRNKWSYRQIPFNLVTRG